MVTSLRSVIGCALALGVWIQFMCIGGALAMQPRYIPSTRYQLPNGLTVVLQEEHSVPVVACNMWVRVGSVNETEAEAGLSHVLEHMLFKGTSSRGLGEIAREVESVGGELNAFTSHEYTVFHIVLASRFLDTGLDVLADAIQHSSLDAEELRKEIEVIVEEIKRGQDIPSRRLGEVVFRTSYRAHPYGRPVIGTEKSVRSFSRQTVVDYYRRWYVPGNMALVVVGDFDTDSLKPKIAEALGAFPHQTVPSPDVAPEPPQQEVRVRVLREEVSETKIELAYHIPDVFSDNVFPLDLLAVILGQGESSRLYQEVKVQAGLVHSISAYSYTPKDPGLFIVNASLDAEDLEKALERILGEAYALRHERVSTEELEKAKTILEADFVYHRETVQGRARMLGYYETTLNDLEYERKYLQGIAAVTPEDIQGVVAAYLTTSNLTAGILMPHDADAGGDEGRIAALCTRAEAAARAASETADRLELRDEVYRATLPNGIRMVIKENHTAPLVGLRAVLLGGTRSETLENNGISNFVAEMLTKGTTELTALEIATEVESMAGNLAGFSGRNSLGVSGEFLSKNLERGLELFAEVLRYPSFDPEEIEKKREDILAAIRRREDNLASVAFDLFGRTVFRQHPYRFPILGEADTVSALTRDQLVAYYQTYDAPQNLVLAIVGDVDPYAVAAKVEELFGSLPRKPLTLPEIPEEPLPEAVREGLENKNKAQAHIVLGFQGTRVTSPDRYPLEVLNAILSGQGGRLFLELRDKRSLAYAVTSFSRDGLDPGVFGVYIATSPEKVDIAIAAIKDQLRLLTEQEVSAEEIERAKKYLVGTYEIDLQRNATQAAQLAFDEAYHIGLGSLSQYADMIYAVSRDDVLRTARRYLDLDRYAVAIVRPAAPGASEE